MSASFDIGYLTIEDFKLMKLSIMVLQYFYNVMVTKLFSSVSGNILK